jgi:hypothetical protein
MDRSIDGSARSSQSADAYLSWAAQVAAAWSAAGALAGGLIVAGFLAAGRLHPEGAVLAALVLATAGGLLGVVHGAILGHLGRPAETDHAVSWADRALALLAAAAALFGAVLLTIWLVLSAVLTRTGSAWGGLALLIGSAIAAGVLVWATLLGWRSLEAAYERWPDHRLGTLLGVGAFAIISLVLLALRPAIPGTGIQLPAVGWIVVAAIATVWLAAPVIIMALRVVHPQATTARRADAGPPRSQ